MSRSGPLILPIVLSLILVASCGSGGPFDPLGPRGVKILDVFPPAQRGLEGALTGDGTTDPDAPLRVGDDEDNRSWRAFTAFRVSIPADATLERAVLRIHLGEVVDDPFGKLGLLFAERIEMGTSLDASDWSATGIASTIGLSAMPLGLQDLDVTPLVRDALARGVLRVDIRLRFGVSVTSDEVASHLHITSFRVDSDPVSLPPTMVLYWQIPAGSE